MWQKQWWIDRLQVVYGCNGLQEMISSLLN